MERLEEEVKKLKEENELLKQRLNNYTNPSCNKIYYEKNKEIRQQKNCINVITVDMK